MLNVDVDKEEVDLRKLYDMTANRYTGWFIKPVSYHIKHHSTTVSDIGLHAKHYSWFARVSSPAAPDCAIMVRAMVQRLPKREHLISISRTVQLCDKSEEAVIMGQIIYTYHNSFFTEDPVNDVIVRAISDGMIQYMLKTATLK